MPPMRAQSKFKYPSVSYAYSKFNFINSVSRCCCFQRLLECAIRVALFSSQEMMESTLLDAERVNTGCTIGVVLDR